MRYRYKLGEDDFRVSYEVVIKVRINAGPESAEEHWLGRVLMSDEDDIEREMYLDAHMSVSKSMTAIKKALQEWRDANAALGLDEVSAGG